MSSDPPSSQNRYTRWFGTFACSIIAVVALTSGIDGPVPAQNGKQTWVFSSLIISMIISFLAVLAHMVKQDFSGTSVEAGLAVIVLAVMTCSLPIIMNPTTGLAVLMNGGIGNANLYFFSWGTFGMALSVLMHFLSHASKAKGMNPNFRRGMWVALIATSVTALASSVDVWQNYNCEKRATSRCNRLVFSISLSCTSATISFLWVLCGAHCHGILDWILGMIMLICWSADVAFLTFGREAPASVLGNLYFSSWIGFVVSCALASGGMKDILASFSGNGGGGGDGGDAAPAPAEGDDADGEKNEDNNPRVGDEEGQEVEPIPAATDAPAATASTPAAQTE